MTPRRVASLVYTVVFTRNALTWTREHRGRCPVTGLNPCPWHPDGGNHPLVGGDSA